MLYRAGIRLIAPALAALTTVATVGCLDHQAGTDAQNPANGTQNGYGQQSYAQPGTQPGSQPGYAPQPGYGQQGAPPQPQDPQYGQPMPQYGQPMPQPAPQYGPQPGPQSGPQPAPGASPLPGFPGLPSLPGFPSPAPGPGPGPSPSPAPGAPPAAPPPAPSAPGGLPFPFPFPLPGAGGAPGQPGQAPSSGAATPIDPNLAGVATVPLMGYSQQEAPGMTREGGIVAANFKEGQTMEQPFQMLPGRCYTVLAVGAGIQQIDISLVAVTPLPQASGVLAHASGANSAALGGRGNCFRWDLPVGINAKYVIRAARGMGMAAGQLYSK